MFGIVKGSADNAVSGALIQVTAIQVGVGPKVGDCTGVAIPRAFSATSDAAGNYRVAIVPGYRTEAQLCLNAQITPPAGSSLGTVTKSGIPLALRVPENGVAPDSVRVDVLF